MNKKKRALVSLIVSLSVFYLSTIFTTPKLIPFSREEAAQVNTVIASDPEVAGANTKDIEVESFSASVTPIAKENPVESADTINTLNTANTANTVDADIANTPDTTDTASTEDADTANTLNTADAASTANVNTANTLDTAATQNTEDAASKKIKEDKAVEQESQKALYANIGISVAKDFVNIRKEASTDSEILGKLYKDSAATILKAKDDWYYVESGSLKGFIKKEFLKTNIPDDEIVEKYGELRIIVAVDGLNVRETTDTESSKLDVVYLNEVYPVSELQEEWVKINVEDDKVCGYVKREFTELTVKFKEAISKEEEQELLLLQAEERAKKETEVKYQEGVSYSTQELKLLACLVHAEAGTQSYEGKLAVANVVLNRVKSSDYPDTIEAVIYQSGQFSVARSGSLDKQLSNYNNYKSNAQKLSIKAARAALEGANNIGSRKYFHSYQAAVRKGYDEKETAVKIGDQLFW